MLNKTWLAPMALMLAVGCTATRKETPDAGNPDVTQDDDDAGTEPVSAPEGPIFVGGERPAEVFVPEGYDHAVATPLLVVLHGYTASGPLMNAYLSLKSHADTRGFLYLTPDGTVDANGQRFWNASDACCDFAKTGVDDSGYLRGLIEETSAIYNVDPKQVFLLGHSNGGFMSYRMACDQADIIAGIVSIAGAMPAGAGSCSPSEPLAGLQIHGTADETVLFEGGVIGGTSYPSAQETVASFAAAVGCAGSLEPNNTTRDLDANIDGAETVSAAYTSCVEQGAAELWTVNDGVHTPSPTDAFMPAAFDFLFAHPKP